MWPVDSSFPSNESSGRSPRSSQLIASFTVSSVPAGSAAGGDNRRSIWPAVEERIVDLVEAHRSTIVFANSRRLAERLTNRLNEIAYERATGAALPDGA